MTANHPFRHIARGVPLLLACAMCLRVTAEVPRQDTNPISRIARLLSPQLVDIEDRITVFEGQLSTCSEHYEHPLKVGLGYRGCRNARGAEDPSITLDLGGEVAVDTIVLIPAQGIPLDMLEIPGDLLAKLHEKFLIKVQIFLGKFLPLGLFDRFRRP